MPLITPLFFAAFIAIIAFGHYFSHYFHIDYYCHIGFSLLLLSIDITAGHNSYFRHYYATSLTLHWCFFAAIVIYWCHCCWYCRYYYWPLLILIGFHITLSFSLSADATPLIRLAVADTIPLFWYFSRLIADDTLYYADYLFASWLYGPQYAEDITIRWYDSFAGWLMIKIRIARWIRPLHIAYCHIDTAAATDCHCHYLLLAIDISHTHTSFSPCRHYATAAISWILFSPHIIDWRFFFNTLATSLYCITQYFRLRHIDSFFFFSLPLPLHTLHD